MTTAEDVPFADEEANQRLGKYIDFITKIYNLIENTDEFTSSGKIYKDVLAKIKFKKANNNTAFSALAISTVNYSLEYHITIKSKHKFSQFLAEVLEHIINLHEDNLLRDDQL